MYVIEMTSPRTRIIHKQNYLGWAFVRVIPYFHTSIIIGIVKNTAHDFMKVADASISYQYVVKLFGQIILLKS